MKRYTGMLLALGLLLLWPQAVRADDGSYKNFTWDFIAEAGTAFDGEGDIIPAVRLYFANSSEIPDYVDIYRCGAEDGEFSVIGTYEWEPEASSGCFCDCAIMPEETYYYRAVAGWYAEGEKPELRSEGADAVSCTVRLGKPQIETVSSGTRNVKILLPGSGFTDVFRYVATESGGIYATGFQIYRSRKEESGYRLIASVPSDESEYKDSTVTKGKLYFYKVRAFYYDKAEGETYTGPFSDIRMCCPGSRNFPDAYGLNLAAERKSTGTIRVSWNSMDGFVAETLCYTARRPGEESFGRPEFVDLSPKAAACTLKMLERDCEYEIRLLVRAKVPYNDGSDNFYYDSRWYVCLLEE